jgi:hypothetical protein
MCQVFTGRVGYDGADGLDTTVKSGKGVGKLFAPTWELVMGYKRKELDEAQYTQSYLALIRKRYRSQKTAFIDLLHRERIVVLCYCSRQASFCHRHLVVDILEKIAARENLPFERGGEID